MITSPDTSSSTSSPPDQAGNRVGVQGGAETVSIKDAAARLGISVNTVRRWIREGRLETERVARPQGYVVYVYLPEQVITSEQNPEGARHHQVPEQVPDRGHDQHVSEQVPIMRDLARAEAMAAYTRSVVEPLVARMVEQESIIRDLERENGRLAAEVAAARPPDPLPVPNPPMSIDRWGAVAPWALGLLAAGSVVALMVMPR
jgi:excisionase family DNA binding protein